MTQAAQAGSTVIKIAAGKYPLLENLLATRGIRDCGLWTVPDVAKLFGVHARTIQQWVRDGKLMSRDLPGRARFLAEDLEDLLRKKQRPSEVEEI